MRRPDWKEALRQEIAAMDGLAFEYGVFDCAIFTARCVKAITGTDPAAQFGAYDHRGALRLLAKHDGVEGLAAHAFGLPIPPNSCHHGDVIEANLELGPTLGICLGVNCAFAGDRQIVYRQRDVIVRGWRV